MKTTQIYLLEAKSSKGGALVAELQTLARQVEQQAGCDGTEIFQDTDAPEKTVFLEHWQSEDARIAAGAQLGKTAFQAIGELLSKPPEMRRVRSVGRTMD